MVWPLHVLLESRELHVRPQIAYGRSLYAVDWQHRPSCRQSSVMMEVAESSNNTARGGHNNSNMSCNSIEACMKTLEDEAETRMKASPSYRETKWLCQIYQ